MSASTRWRAPAQDGAVLADPPLSEVGALLAQNRRRLDAASASLLGRPLAELRQLAGQEALAAARDYLSAAGEPVPEVGSTSLVLAGHQPELFHPGVWVKNFALNGIARAHGCAPLNLVVDNDTAKSAAVRLPQRSLDGTRADGTCEDQVSLATVPFDHWAGEVPYEELRVQDEGLFGSFGDRAGAMLAEWGLDSLLPAFWAEAHRQVDRTPLVGERFATARRALERRWGCHNLEVPLSALCRTEAFAWFVGGILHDLPRFHQIYNETVQEHRRRFGVRSRNHPVPDLAREGDWLEVPFWGWRAGQTQRSRLVVRAQADRFELRAGDEDWPALPRDATVNGWRDLERRGFKVRTRALTTTLFARLFLGDLFVHGIGGGNYDVLTDAMLRRLYAFEPPAFLVLSATLHLPLPASPASPGQHRRLVHNLRDLHYNPQRHLSQETGAEPEVAAVVTEKKAWVERRPENRRGRRERFRTIRALTERLQPLVSTAVERTRQQLTCTAHQLHDNAILQRRDYAFCLFPEKNLRPFCTRFL